MIKNMLFMLGLLFLAASCGGPARLNRVLAGVLALAASCGGPEGPASDTAADTAETNQDTFNYYPEHFADKKILRYKVPGF